MFMRNLSRGLILCSLFATLTLTSTALADPYSGDGGGQYQGVPDEVQTRQPPPPPPQTTGKVTGTDWTVSSLSTTSDPSRSIGVSTTRGAASWRAMLTMLRLELKVLVLRF